jgi:thymidylate kinase
MNKGRLIVFVGIDGSGKTTQAKILVRGLAEKGIRVAYVWCRWEPFFLRPLIKRWKNKNAERSDSGSAAIRNIKRKLLDRPLFRWLWLTSFFIDYGLQIFLKVRVKLIKNQLVISDRIFYDSIIDQAVNLGKRSDWLLNSMDSLWMRIFFPEPQLVIYVDCPEDIAFSRKDDAPDVEYLIDRRKQYLKLAEKYGWMTVDGTMPVEKLANWIKDETLKRLGL